MIGHHLALIVEDDGTLAEDLAEILSSFACDSIIADNKRDAVASIRSNAFCFVLLDLEIKLEPDSIKGHTEHGNSLLREIRQLHADHTGRCYWLPILVVSGFAREVAAAVEVMKDGASDVIHKPFVGREVSETIRRALEHSGRATHDRCAKKPAPRALDADEGLVLTIPGDRVRQRTLVRVGSRSVPLTDGSMRVLLHLMVGRVAGKAVHKRDLGASDDKGFKGISVLRDALKGALPDGADIIGNDYHGNYRLTDDVTIGSCNTEKLVEIADQRITDLAQQLRRRLDARRPKSDGNF
jgi:DNA-binding response OmpR family regulator